MIYINFIFLCLFDVKPPVYTLAKCLYAYICLQKGGKKSLSKAQIYIKMYLNKEVPFALSSDKDLGALFVDKKTVN